MTTAEQFTDGRKTVRDIPCLVSSWERAGYRWQLNSEARKELRGKRRAWALGVLWELR